ncbi:hypothetical protein GQ43DRAFT_440818 [Delitschia confertaspora ATCC 74209]|uniref:Tyrosine specific protein phosphatases domain-containing protein n=1 Tax=Delitschia confertaspora ATCC 74209 TaxID=1513339 RepID=A0A9P4JRB7_9PLEO|nr:hypothetical protein GQ43DRAFT_440818 [Delitschia confertaspora ATCC 74209]
MLSAKPVELDSSEDPPECNSSNTQTTAIATATTLHPSPFPSHPFIPVPSLSNFRDIGGWPIYSPSNPSICTGHVRPGIIYRGSDTNRIQPSGIHILRDTLNIKTDFDLRSTQQIEATGGYKDLDGIRRIWAPIFKEEEYTEEAARRRYQMYAEDGTEGIVKAFVEVLTSGAEAFAVILRSIIETVPEPGKEGSERPPALFIHCTTGNNRTGALVAMILLLLGVAPTGLNSVAEEYALSELGLAPTRHKNVERLLKKGAFRELGPKEAKKKCERMVGARVESMEALVRKEGEVQRRWGAGMGDAKMGAERYFLDVVGLGEDEIRRVREVLTVWGRAKDWRGVAEGGKGQRMGVSE